MESIAGSVLNTENMFGSNAERLYGSIVEIPLRKRFLSKFTELLAYLDSYFFTSSIVFIITSFLRSFQNILPSLALQRKELWKPGTAATNVFAAISIFGHIFPPSIRNTVCAPFLIVYGVYEIINAIIIVHNTFYYSAKSNLPRGFVTYFNAIVAVSYVCLPISYNLLGEYLSGLIAGDYKYDSLSLTGCVLAFIGSFSPLLIDCYLYQQTIVFRKQSFASINKKANSIFLISCVCNTFICALTSHLSKIFTVVALSLQIISNALQLIDLYRNEPFIMDRDTKLAYQSFISSIFCSILIMVLLLVDEEVSPSILFAIIAIYCISFVVGVLLMNHRRKKDILLLDQYGETFDIVVFNKPNDVITSVVTGFKTSHPVALSFEIFDEAIKVWPDDGELYFVYARFAGIYPEMTQRLTFLKSIIGKSTNLNKDKSGILIASIISIIRLRETSISVEMKRKIHYVSNCVSKAKTKLRLIWDSILLGNVSNLGATIEDAYEATTEADIELLNLVNMYPNDRFIARIYKNYVREVKADFVLYKEWVDKTRTLEQGKNITSDYAHELGLYHFPLIPTAIDGITRDISVDPDFNGSDNNTDGDMFSEDENDVEGKTMIADMIKNHKMHGVKIGKTLKIILLLLFTLIGVALIILFYYLTIFYQEPFGIIYSAARLLEVNTLMPAFLTRLVMESVDSPITQQKVVKTLNYTSMYVHYFNDQYTTREQLRYIISCVAENANGIAALRDYMPDEPEIDVARSYVFDQNVVYQTFINGNIHEEKISAESIPVRIASIMTDIINIPSLTSDDVGSDEFLTATSNYLTFCNQIRELISHITIYVYSARDSANKIYGYSVLDVAIFVIVLYIIDLAVEIKYISKNCTKVYKYITLLPKTTISKVSSSFSHICGKKNDLNNREDIMALADVNKQEENIIKTFNSLSGKVSNSSLNLKLIILAVLFILVSFIFFFKYERSIENLGTTAVNNMPHIRSILITTAFMTATIANINKLALIGAGFTKADYSPAITKLSSISIQRGIEDNFQKLMFGDDEEITPLSTLNDEFEKAKDLLKCIKDQDYLREKLMVMACFDISMQPYILNAQIEKLLSYTVTNQDSHLTDLANDSIIDLVWQTGMIGLYNTLFCPMRNDILSQITGIVESLFYPIIYIVIAVIVVVAILTYFSFVVITNEEDKIKFTLSLLQHCPTSTIFSMHSIVTLLNGDYSDSIDDRNTRDSSFFDDVVDRLTDAIIIVKEKEGKIVGVNNSFIQMFGTKKLKGIIDFGNEHEFIGTNVNDFFMKQFGETIDTRFPEPTFLTMKKDGMNVCIRFTSIILNEFIVIYGRDKTATEQHKRLITDERKKTDTMLSSILPPSLVPRVKAGEKNISFACQSCTVVFIDIVSFTPWCGSNTAQYVMKMLNVLFKEYDALVANHKTMTRIKCIGDCYMAAGGIFDEVNSPATHAKEVVQFGCEAIKKVLEIDQEFNENIRVRVGVNSGGPVVAGVLGTDKPTFEIIGPAINMAQQMEHNGVSMEVHISRSVYELIYGGDFNIKERGEIEVKRGKVMTYLVTP